MRLFRETIFFSFIAILIKSYAIPCTFSSSLWCSSTSKKIKKCSFKNLFYNVHTNFIFLFTEESVIFGIDSRNDLKYIFATSVFGHSALPLKISIVDKPELLPQKLLFFQDAILLHRFKPDNIMHVIHDDLLPLYTLYLEMCLGNVTACALKYNVFFSDNNIEGPFSSWYESFSRGKPIQLSRLSSDQTICFSDIRVGFSDDSIFYQYGFSGVRGVNKINSGMKNLIHGFTEFILYSFNLHKTSIDIYNEGNIVFLTRKINRKILNEKFVENSIKAVFENANHTVKVYKTDFSLSSSRDIVFAIANSKYLIGMHGAGMFLGMFLPRYSKVIELFPYGINERSVSPLYVMSQIPGIQFQYFSWQNSNELHTFLHPEYLPQFGGFQTLPLTEKMNVLNLSNSPSYKCCNDAVYLSRMYQDTLIDESISEVLQLALNSAFQISSSCNYSKQWMFPSTVSNVSCHKNMSGLFLSWDPPFNMIFSSDLVYKLHLETSLHSFSISTDSLFVFIQMHNEKVKIWIMCIFRGVEGFDLSLTC